MAICAGALPVARPCARRGASGERRRRCRAQATAVAEAEGGGADEAPPVPPPPQEAPARKSRELPTFEDVSTAAFRIQDGVVRTRCYRASESLRRMAGCELYLKAEYEQHTGSFKERGARNALLSLPDDAHGVTCASAGNHALAMAYHGKELGVPVTVVMPTIAPLTKVNKCRALGARVILAGTNIAEAAQLANEEFVEKEGLTYVNGFDDPAIIAGAGSVGLEVLSQVKDLDAIVVPAGGGGLIAGILLAVKTLKPDITVVGVEPGRCASLSAALAAGEPVTTPLPGPTLADGLAVPKVGAHAFDVISPRIDKVVQVSEQDIALTVLALVEQEKVVQEGAGAAGLAALLGGKLPELEGKRVAVPLCGGNIDSTMLGRVIERGLVFDYRLVRFSCVVPDRPGGIARAAAILAEVGVSVKDVQHQRAWLQEDLHSVEVIFTCETNGLEHARTLQDRLEREMREGTAVSAWGREALALPAS